MGYMYTSSTPGLQDELYAEQVAAFKQLPGPMSMSHLDLMPLLHACVRETLRLRPPIMSIMRKARQDFEVKAQGKTYIVPKGSQVRALLNEGWLVGVGWGCLNGWVCLDEGWLVGVG
jgi:sterol 14-demethylase